MNGFKQCRKCMLTCSVTVDKSEGCMRWTFSAAFDADLRRCLTSSSANGVGAYYIRYIGPLLFKH